jgi:kinesin family protein 5
MLQGQDTDVALGAVETKEYAFDGTFAPDANQREVFTRVGLPVLRECLQGFNGTILAYGQTGSGKTHSLLHQGQSGEEAGILPRLVAHLFMNIAQDPSNVYIIEAAALQVYNEQIDDLLHAEHQTSGGHNIAVQNGGVVPGLTWLKCLRPEALLEAFNQARSNVVYAETKMNKASSRSHAIFQIRITKRRRATATAGEGVAQKIACTISRISVVDLAGSERVKRSGVEGAQFKEATAINKSLLAFGNVVSALAAKKAHVPYRDSKLTRILDGSIGGNCKTALLVCASPAMESAHESLSTLEFASRAMKVVVDAKVNECMVEVGAKALLADLTGDGASDSAVPLNPQAQAELAALRKASNEASERAQAEAKRHQEIAVGAKALLADAKSQAEQLRQEAQQAEIALNKAKAEQAEEAERMRKDVQDAEERLKHERQQRTEEAQMFQSAAASAEKSVEEARSLAQAECVRLEARLVKMEEQAAAAHSSASAAEDRAALAEERAALAERAASEWEARAYNGQATIATLRDEAAATATQLAAERHGRHLAAEALQQATAEAARLAVAAETTLATEKSRAAEELAAEKARASEEIAAAVADAQRAAASGDASRAAERQHASEKLATANASLAAERQRASEALATATAEAACFQEQAEAAASRSAALEKELARQVEELRVRTLALTEAQEALEMLRIEAEERENALRTQHTAEFESLASAHSDEAAQLHVEHVVAMDAQREAFEARLSTGREEFEAHLSDLQAMAELEKSELQKQLATHSADAQKVERQREAWQQCSLRETREAADCKLRRLTAVFSAARCVMVAKESELRAAHDDLARRFAARESRQEDLSCIAQQKATLADQRAMLRESEQRAEDLHRRLANRDATDKVFGRGSGEMRRGRAGSASPGSSSFGSPPGQHNAMPPLPGKKLNELAHPFHERRRRGSLDKLPAASCRALSADAAPCDLPISVR